MTDQTSNMATLQAVADLLRVHPRTVLRALHNEDNPYWVPGHNPNVNLRTAAIAFGAKIAVIFAAFDGDEDLLTPEEAATELGINPREFRRRGYNAAVRHGGVVRYARSALIAEHFKRWG